MAAQSLERADRSLVGVVIVNWNDAAATNACLDSLAASSHAARRHYVVDNASEDDSPRAIQAAHPTVNLVRATTNLGYGGAFNRGFRRALEDGCAYVWLLNNDATVEPATLSVLLDAARRYGPAIYSPRIVREGASATPWYAGGRLDWRLKSYHRTAEDVAEQQVHPVAWATGCSLFCSADVAQRVGPMDERYFLYLEDVDWCLRARSLGLPTLYVPSAHVVHGVSRSVHRLDPYEVRYYAWRNYYLLVSSRGRWWQRLYGRANLASRFVKIALRSAFFPAYRRDRLYRARTHGLWDFARGRFGRCSPPAPAASPERAPAEAVG